MADLVVNCEKYKGRCEELADIYKNGLSSTKLQQMGIAPGSARAQELEDTLVNIFLHCCTTMHPGAPPVDDTQMASNAVPLVLSRRYAWVNPLLLAIFVAAAVAAAQRFKLCALVGSRLLPGGGKVCVYICNDGAKHTYMLGPGTICAPAVLLPV